MLVYRIEDKNGDGPYHTPDTLPEEACRNSINHPTPTSDGIWLYEAKTWCPHDYHFGFQNKTLLREWFGRYSDHLKKGGFKCSVYKIHGRRVMQGRTQCAFVLKKAELQKSLEIDEILP